MGRRKSNDRALDDLFAIAAKLPWQVSIALAVVSFLILHAIAAQDPGVATSTKDIGAAAAKTIFLTIARFGQFVLPLVLLGGAVAGFFARRRRTELVEAVASSTSPDSLNDMNWREFESLIEEAFRLRGYTVRRLGGDGPDGGVDLVLDRGAEKVLVQCKQWRAMRVGVPVVRELYGAMAARGAASGIVVTSGGFTPDAVEFAGGRNLRLIAGPELHELIREARAARPLPTSMTGGHQSASTKDPQGCPRCGSPMVKRQAKRGASAGQGFYGCSALPGLSRHTAANLGALGRAPDLS